MKPTFHWEGSMDFMLNWFWGLGFRLKGLGFGVRRPSVKSAFRA